MKIIILDGKYMTSRSEAYEYINRIIQFPDYFGKNLDALADCLSELNSEVIVIIINEAVMLENLGSYGNKMLDVFREVSEEEGTFTFIEKR